MLDELKLPEYLEQDEEEIHDRMLDTFPANYDKSEGAWLFDATKVVAMEKAEMLSFQLAHTVMNMFPQFAEAEFLDHHAKRDGVKRREAITARGFIAFTGEPGTVIPEGTIVSTTAEVDEGALLFQTKVEAIISTGGNTDVEIEALTAGAIGNVPSGAVTNVEESINGVQSLTNPNQLTGGIDEEDDESLRKRILDRNRNKELSGSKKDYERWAKEVAGVGDVIVVPLWNGPGTVKVMVSPTNGGIATPELINEVQNHIAPDKDKGGGLAPIGALVTIDSVNIRSISVSFSAELESGYSTTGIVEKLKTPLRDYFSSLSIGGLVRHSRVGSIIIQMEGIKDYDNLLLNGAKDNVQLTAEEVAGIGMVSINGG